MNASLPGEPHINGADASYNIAIAFNPLTFKFKVNGATYDPPTVPILLQTLSGAVNPSDLVPADSIYPLPKNKVIQLSIPAGVTSSVVGDLVTYPYMIFETIHIHFCNTILSSASAKG
nr:laccase 14 [Cyathus bulleri]